VYGFSSRWPLIWNYGFKPLAPEFVRRCARRLRRSARPAFPHLNSDFSRRIDLASRLRSAKHVRRFNSYGKDSNYRSLCAGSDTHYWELNDRESFAFGIEQRHPFFDRRLVEFSLSIPDDQLWRGDTVKYVLVQAMKEQLPPSVLNRRRQPHFNPFVIRALTDAGCESILESSPLRDLGWIDELALLDRLRIIKAEGAGGESLWWTWMAYGVDLWYRTAVDRRSEVAPLQLLTVPSATSVGA
ncbi:MAG TPA: asparagine synthase-related protein, partial [Bryobacteraceae bacterium]|nr:asparagine synthase-related protein [Bryobacteraceae bacterium]